MQEKGKGYWDCPSGIPGVETMLPMLLDAVNRKEITLARVVRAASENPAMIFRWDSKGFIREGFDADLAIVDMKRAHTVENAALFTKAGYSPFNGRKLKGFVEKTIVGGNVLHRPARARVIPRSPQNGGKAARQKSRIREAQVRLHRGHTLRGHRNRHRRGAGEELEDGFSAQGN